MQIGRPETHAFARADAEYRRRNGGAPIPAHPVAWEPYWGIGRLDSPGGQVDAFAIEEASSLLAAAMSTRDPEQTARLFAAIPSAKVQRDAASRVPWWKRIFGDSTSGPPPVGLPIRDIHPRAVPIWRDPVTDTSPVYNAPIVTMADLMVLQPSALPARTVSGGGGASGTAGDLIRGQLTTLAHEYALMLKGEFSPQLALNIAIQARNAAVQERATKTLVAHWNEEIRQLLWIMRRMP